LQNPINYTDPDGQQVRMTYNKTNRKLALVDMDIYKKGLPTLTVSAKDYKIDGIRDDNGKLTHNQVLVINNVFSGGYAEDSGDITRSEQHSEQLEIPNGSYDILEYEKHSRYVKLDPIDDSRYDDHHQGQENSQGKTRSGYRLHLGTESHGCVTICDRNEDRSEEWDMIKSIFNSTTKEEVPKREGNQKWNPTSYRLKYGELKVKGEDNVKKVDYDNKNP